MQAWLAVLAALFPFACLECVRALQGKGQSKAMGKRQRKERARKFDETRPLRPRPPSSGQRDKRFVPTLFVRLACYSLQTALATSAHPAVTLPSHRSGCIARPQQIVALSCYRGASPILNRRAANPRRAIPHSRSIQLAENRPLLNKLAPFEGACMLRSLISPAPVVEQLHPHVAASGPLSPGCAGISGAHEISSTCTCCI